MCLKLYNSVCDNDTILRQAIKNFIASYKVDKENPTIFPLSLPSDDSMNILYAHQANSNMDLSIKIYNKSIKECSGILDKMYSNKLTNWITKDKIFNLWENSIIELWKNSKQYEKYFIPNIVIEELNKLKYFFENRKIEIHNGHAGTGKSTSVMNVCNSNLKNNCVIVSLSNTICNMFKQKVPHIETCSCSKAKFLFEIDKPEIFENADIIVLDEFSQWGFEWLPLLNKILSSNTTAQFYIMGDVDQIPTFLSSGSLLYSLMNEFPDKTIQHNTQYRFMNVPHYRELVNDVLNNTVPMNTIISELNDTVLNNTDCFITGTNDNVNMLNEIMLKKKHNITSKNIEEIIRQTGGDVPLICCSTTEINGTKVYCNTRYKVKTIAPDYVVLESCVDKSLVKCKRYDYDKFKLAYAITVKRAQGLEWDNVCCYITSRDKNLKTFNSLYVALTRGKQNIIIASDNNGKGMTVEDLQNILKIKYKFYNNFNEME